jgi:FkbM family methyltransferase
MNYFLDLGTHYFVNGDCENGLLTFEKQLFFGSKPPYNWHVLTFEPSQDAWASNIQHKNEIAKRFAGFEMHQAAISDADGKAVFKWLPYWKAASTCIGEPLTEIEDKQAVEYEVEAIDIRRVIEEIVAKDPQASIYVKCDIEGAEFSVLPRLLTIEGVGQWVKAIYVEWHERFWHHKPRYAEILRTKGLIERRCEDERIALYAWV